MPTVVSHAVAAASLVTVFPPWTVPRRLAWVGAACAMLPDLDVVGLRLGVPYGSLLGHRGLTHSLAFALLVAGVALAMIRRRPALCRQRGWAGLYLFLATASHGLLDACTNGGLGVAFLSPFERARYFGAFRPVAVSPIGARFFSARGLLVLQSELRWVWLPSVILAVAATLVWRAYANRRRARPPVP